MIFPKRVDFTPTQNGILGQTLRFEITREFAIESICVNIIVTTTAAAATPTADGLTGIVRRLQLQTSDGARTRNVIDVSGAGCLEYSREINMNWDRNTYANFRTNPGAGTYRIQYYLYCSHPQLEDPVGSTLLLPAPRFNSNPVLSVTLATQAQMDLHPTTPTFAVSACNCYLVINRRQITRPNWPTFDWELAEAQVNYTATGNALLYELQVPGSYTGILLMDYTAAGAGCRLPIETVNGENRLQLLGTVLRRFRVADVECENDRSIVNHPATWAMLSGDYYLDFLCDKNGETGGDFGSVLDTNILQASGARAQLLQDITGGAAVSRHYLTHRVFGNLAELKF